MCTLRTHFKTQTVANPYAFESLNRIRGWYGAVLSNFVVVLQANDDEKGKKYALIPISSKLFSIDHRSFFKMF